MYKMLIAMAAVLVVGIVCTANAAQVLLRPELVLSETYTDNLFLEPDNEDWSYITEFGLDVTNEILWRTAGIRLNYNPSYNMYSEFKEFDYWRHAANAGIWKVIKRNTRLELNDTYLWTNDPLDESDEPAEEGQPGGPVIEADPNRRGRDKYYTNVADARISHQFGAEDDVFIAVEHRVFREVDPLPGMDVDNYEAIVPSMGLVFHFTHQWSTELDASYENTQYQDRNDRKESNANFRFLYRFTRSVTGLVGFSHTILKFDLDETEDDEDYDINSPFVGFRYDVGDNTNIEIALAYYRQRFEHSEEDEGFNINSDIDTRWQFRTAFLRLAGGSGHMVDDNGSADNGLNIYGHARIEAGYNFTPHVMGTIYGRYRYDEFPNEEPERIRHTAGAGAEMNWQATRWMALALSGDYSDVNSDDTTEEYTEGRAMLTVRIFTPNPLRLEEEAD